VRCRPRGVAELPYEFGERFAGESKSTVKEGLRFLRHLVLLRTGKARARMIAVGLVGASGFLPNLAVLWLLIHNAGMHYVPAEIIANQAGLLWNFVIIDSLVYRNHRRQRRRSVRMLGFAALGNADLVARIPLLALLVTVAGIPPVPATALSLGLVFALRFVIVDRVLYRRRPGPSVTGVVPAGAVARRRRRRS
jgi:dolichol-phosphate mannosyltransferase